MHMHSLLAENTPTCPQGFPSLKRTPHSHLKTPARGREGGGEREASGLHPVEGTLLLICDRYSRLSTWRHAWQNPISFLCPHPCVIDLLAVFLLHTLSGATQESRIIQVLWWNVGIFIKYDNPVLVWTNNLSSTLQALRYNASVLRYKNNLRWKEKVVCPLNVYAGIWSENAICSHLMVLS